MAVAGLPDHVSKRVAAATAAMTKAARNGVSRDRTGKVSSEHRTRTRRKSLSRGKKTARQKADKGNKTEKKAKGKHSKKKKDKSSWSRSTPRKAAKKDKKDKKASKKKDSKRKRSRSNDRGQKANKKSKKDERKKANKRNDKKAKDAKAKRKRKASSPSGDVAVAPSSAEEEEDGDMDSDASEDDSEDGAAAVADRIEVSACTSQSACELETPVEEDEEVDEDESVEDSSSEYEYYTDEEDAPVMLTQKPKSEKKEDIIHFDWNEGDMLKKRYRITRLLGDGTFGRVLLVWDQKKNRELAIKVIREIPKYVRNAKREAEILNDIVQADPKHRSGCVVMYDTFMHDNRIFCLAFEPLGPSLYDVLKRNKFRGYFMQDIQNIAHQCLEALAFLHDGLKLTHTDLKLENVLFVSAAPSQPAEFPREESYLERHKSQRGKAFTYVRPVNCKIKLIDFGNATYELEHHSSIINTRQYRAPEVTLAMGWDELSDQWSTGCILMELYTGDLLFRTHDSLEHLKLMEKVIGEFPQTMFAGASDARKDQFLAAHEADGVDPLRLRWPPEACTGSTPEAAVDKIRKQPRLAELVDPQHADLADFASCLLRLDPRTRPSCNAALRHPFFSKSYTD
eukprot:TRINITY_DN2915_c2_g1_i1.p1 TRINITY_DN2915_c2_g1~~TRINITY_DN2915_c2_g1_i1.p1  ORF type:complete len:624 (+),score=146.87 TRINITY_DN2915_c2_g1_i1:110-1981(+)